SPGMGRPSRSAAEAAELGARYARFAGVEPGNETALKKVPVEKLLAAQGELARSLQGFAMLALPFSPVRDGHIIGGNIVEQLRDGVGAHVDVMVGTTREEMAAFHVVDQAVQNADESAVKSVFERIC